MLTPVSSRWKARLCLVLAAALNFSQLLPAAEHAAVTPAPRDRDSWVERSALLNQRIKDTPNARILFIGDSITHGWEGAGKEVWERYYRDRRAVNLGIGGDRTQHVLWRLQNGNLEGVSPEVAVIMIGTNNSNGNDHPAGEIADGVRAIVQELRSKTPETQILVLGIFPRGEKFNAQRGKLAQVNQVLHKLDDEPNVHYLDIGHRFLNEDGDLPTDIMPDFLHLSPAGYQLWAEAIEPTLAGLLNETSKLATGAVNPSGSWTWTIQGPDGEPVEAALELKADGNRLSGRFARDATRWLEIQSGRIEGDKLYFIVERDRPDGDTMVYDMTATVSGNELHGWVVTELNDEEVRSEWSARRN